MTVIKIWTYLPTNYYKCFSLNDHFNDARDRTAVYIHSAFFLWDDKTYSNQKMVKNYWTFLNRSEITWGRNKLCPPPLAPSTSWLAPHQFQCTPFEFGFNLKCIEFNENNIDYISILSAIETIYLYFYLYLYLDFFLFIFFSIFIFISISISISDW